MPEQALTCLCCEKELTPVGETNPHQPYGGIFAVTSGNYGSRVWDELDGRVAVLIVCDDCLREHAARIPTFLPSVERTVRTGERPLREVLLDQGEIDQPDNIQPGSEDVA
jgi:hypothetical protein